MINVESCLDVWTSLSGIQCSLRRKQREAQYKYLISIGNISLRIYIYTFHVCSWKKWCDCVTMQNEVGIVDMNVMNIYKEDSISVNEIDSVSVVKEMIEVFIPTFTYLFTFCAGLTSSILILLT